MELYVSNICPTATTPELKRAVASVLHGPGYLQFHTLPLNFDIRPLPGRGSAILTLPSVDVGKKFLKEYGGYRPRCRLVAGRLRHTLQFEEGRQDPRPEMVNRLRQTPYVDPIKEDQQLKLAAEFRTRLIRVSLLQFGWECRDGVFSIEFERPCYDRARLRFDGETRQFRLRLHECDDNIVVAIRASQVSGISVGTDLPSMKPAIFFSLFYPPTFESEPPTNVALEDFFDMSDMTFPRQNGGPSRWRLSAIDHEHEPYSEFTSLSMRIVCETDACVSNFRWICRQAHIPIHEQDFPVLYREIFDLDVLDSFQDWLSTLPWAVAFQTDALLRAGILDPLELLHLAPHLEKTYEKYGIAWTAALIRHFGNEARDPSWYRRPRHVGSAPSDALMDLFTRCRNTFSQPPIQDTQEETFDCYHARVTPTRVLLDGPFPERSNRVMRHYNGYTDNFLRVSFVDENRLQCRFDRDVDAHKFIQERYGTFLLDGLTVAGRHFDFLAYSQSGLKQHSVWFVRDFEMSSTSGAASTVLVTADSIIEGLGVFHNIPQDPELMRCPARYGARIAQAFTTTEAALEVEVEEVFHVRDIKDSDGRRSFTDGVGTMSMELAREIWDALKSKSAHHRRARRCMPKAIQIRFQGYKGMLSVDYRLQGRAICLRPSMKKFNAPGNMMIEVASVFNKPGKFHLNRQLIMMLEGLSVRGGYQVFKKLQDAVIRDTKEATKSLRDAATLCEGYGLGTAFKVPSVYLDLAKVGVHDLTDTFSRRMLSFGIYHILRDLKYQARIPVPGGFSLVGVADIHRYLKEGEIFACVANSDDEEPIFLDGRTMITRSPTIHPGDIQIVHAIGRPPKGTVFDIEPLTNTVVFSTRGARPLASCLSGGDLDGDVFVCSTMEELLPQTICEPAEYKSAPRKTVPHESTREDVAEFIMEYLYSDKIGIIASAWLTLADQSNAGIFDDDCLTLAELHSDAADYPKSGNPISPREIPRSKLGNVKPDWKTPELTERHHMGLYYESQRFVGRLYREVQLPVPQAYPPPTPSLDDPLTAEDALDTLRTEAFAPRDAVETAIYSRVCEFAEVEPLPLSSRLHFGEVWAAFSNFVQTMHQISVSFNISPRRSTRLTEEEIVAGTIVAQSSQPAVRKEAMSQMREQASILVNRITGQITGPREEGPHVWLKRAWLAYRISALRPNTFGHRSFGLVAMHEIFVAIRAIESADDV